MLRRVLKPRWCVVEAFPKKSCQKWLLLYKVTPTEVKKALHRKSGFCTQLASSEVI